MGVASDGCIELTDSLGCVDHEKSDIGRVEVLVSHHDRKFLCHEMSLALTANPGCVDEAKVAAIVFDDFIDRVARSAGNRRDNRAVGRCQAIQQSGFPYIRMADDGHLDLM